MYWATFVFFALLCAGTKANDSGNTVLERQPDFVIVGAGSAGSVLANRLSEEEDWQILLIEAGGDPLPLTENPFVWVKLLGSSQDWGYKTEPDPRLFQGLEGRVCSWAAGKVLGGTSVINAMAYQRGNNENYDSWEAAGNSGWGYKDIFPYFLKSEDFQDTSRLPSKFHNTGGYLTVNSAGAIIEAGQLLEKAANERGVEIINDINRDKFNGFGPLDSTVRDGARCSTEKAFLRPARQRPNLVIWKNTQVSKVLIDENKRAYGVEYVDESGNVGYVNTTREVILSAGSIKSPNLLFLSGIGPASQLKGKNIDVIEDLPVGENLQDHFAFPGIVFTLPDNTTYIPPNFLTNAVGFINTKNDSEYPNVEILSLVIPKNQTDEVGKVYIADFFGMSFATSDVYKEITELADTLIAFPILIRPKSRGSVLLRENDYRKQPIIIANYSSDAAGEDLSALIEGIDFLVSLNNTEVFQNAGITLKRVNFPACSQFDFPSRNYWICAIRQVGGTMWHFVGTNKMGATDDPTSVVDPSLKVKGISGLRVVDASIMPIIPSSHINVPTITIAEKSADIIKKDYNKLNK